MPTRRNRTPGPLRELLEWIHAKTSSSGGSRWRRGALDLGAGGRVRLAGPAHAGADHLLEAAIPRQRHHLLDRWCPPPSGGHTANEMTADGPESLSPFAPERLPGWGGMVEAGRGPAPRKVCRAGRASTGGRRYYRRWLRRDGGTGIRVGLKNRSPSGGGGSSPPLGTSALPESHIATHVRFRGRLSAQ